MLSFHVESGKLTKNERGWFIFHMDLGNKLNFFRTNTMKPQMNTDNGIMGLWDYKPIIKSVSIRVYLWFIFLKVLP